MTRQNELDLSKLRGFGKSAKDLHEFFGVVAALTKSLSDLDLDQASQEFHRRLSTVQTEVKAV
jgi:hypothetical protein